MWRIDLVSLRLFVAVCEEGSIARASEREFIAASAISKRINDLETLVGAALLQRHKWGVSPTPAGEAMLHHARNVLRSLEKMQGELSEYVSGVRGYIRLFANISSMVETLSEDIGTFLAHHENVKIDLEEHVSSQVVRAVAEGSTDIGICWAQADTRELQVFPYRTDHLVAVMHPGHPLAPRPTLAFADTLDHDQIGLHPDSMMYATLRPLAAQLGKTLRFRIHVSTFESACRMVRANLAMAIVPEEAVTLYRTLFGLHQIRLSDPWAVRQQVICVRDYEALPVPARLLVDHLRADSS
ncbi:MAG: LysR family transcriptional regulator [Burkholderiales bacterium]|nr:LysR family transcriptional regulator [Burkholderiales bacterium]